MIMYSFQWLKKLPSQQLSRDLKTVKFSTKKWKRNTLFAKLINEEIFLLRFPGGLSLQKVAKDDIMILLLTTWIIRGRRKTLFMQKRMYRSE